MNYLFYFATINKLKNEEYLQYFVFATQQLFKKKKQKEIENFRKHIFLNILTIYQNKMFNKFTHHISLFIILITKDYNTSCHTIVILIAL